jgi:hypothetical protein
MFSLPPNSKRIIAGLLLGLFAFILAEKNIHRHEQAELFKVQQEQASVQSTSACLICDFQLAADADLPLQTTTSAPTIHTIKLIAEASSALPLPITLYRSDRGPPASWLLS